MSHTKYIYNNCLDIAKWFWNRFYHFSFYWVSETDKLRRYNLKKQIKSSNDNNKVNYSYNCTSNRNNRWSWLFLKINLWSSFCKKCCQNNFLKSTILSEIETIILSKYIRDRNMQQWNAKNWLTVIYEIN